MLYCTNIKMSRFQSQWENLFMSLICSLCSKSDFFIHHTQYSQYSCWNEISRFRWIYYISVCHLSIYLSIYIDDYIGVEWCLVCPYYPERMVRKCHKEILLPYCPEFTVDVKKMTFSFHGVENTTQPSDASHTFRYRTGLPWLGVI